MTNQTQYGIKEAKQTLPARNLLVVPSTNTEFSIFGPNSYRNNVAEMQKQYSHSAEIPVMTFNPATTNQSIAIAAYDPASIKRYILDKRWLQAGGIVRTNEGVFVNPARDAEGNAILNMKGYEKINGIYLGTNFAGFAPYESFQTGVQESGKFVEGGLARVLEHTKGKKAENLAVISSPEFYKLGVNVWGFDMVSEPVERVAALDSYRRVGGDMLGVDGNYLGDFCGYYGCSFGVRSSVSAEAK